MAGLGRRRIIFTLLAHTAEIDMAMHRGMTRAMGDPSTDNAPIVQLLLTMSFSPSLDDISIIDIAGLYEIFRPEFPVFRQIARAAPMSYTLIDNEPIFPQITGTPRVAFSTADTSKKIFFQNDRLSLGWDRISTLEAAAEPWVCRDVCRVQRSSRACTGLGVG